MLEFIEHHGAPLIFVLVFLDQLGLPIPSTPLLFAIGALAGRGSLEPVSTLMVATAASLCADLAWFQIGRRKGRRVLALLCRVALEPDTCVSRTEDMFSRHGVKSLVVAKFVPGFDTAAPALAGMLGIRTVPFVLWSLAGGVLWLVAFGGLGYVFSRRIEELVAGAERLGNLLGLLIAGFLVAYIGWKYLQRQRVLRGLRMERITPEELHRRIVAGQDPVIVDVRQEGAIGVLPFTIAGARFLALEELDQRHHEIPRDRDVILYCS